MRSRKHPALGRATKSRVPQHHAHGCTQCGWRYTDSCDERESDGLCPACAAGSSRRRLTDENYRPRPCCSSSSLVTDPDTLVRYKLGGAKSWYICDGPSGCYRTHPFNPAGVPA